MTKEGKSIASKEGGVRICMYNVGFGDAFLVTVPTSKGPRRVLFDCGSIASAGPTIADVVEQIIADAKDADGIARIHVVVGTHRHRDHVSGFDHPGWKDVEVEEVWMPWTEDPKDSEAKGIRDRQNRIAVHLSRSVEIAAASVSLDVSRQRTVEMMQQMVGNALTNQGAMKTLHEGFAGTPKRRFLPTKAMSDEKESRALQPEALPGVTVHILGPSRDQRVIRDMDPPIGRSYLSLVEAGSTDEQTLPEPFNEEWSLNIAEAADLGLNLIKRDRAIVKKRGEGFDEAVAVALDQAVNGTSLMLLLQIGESYLLFPGDAQWGTWRAALENQESRALLERTTFYKVSHHGSHNGSPKEFISKVFKEERWSMVSTRRTKQWPNIPRSPLMEAIVGRKGKLLRTDELTKTLKQAKVRGSISVELELPL